VPERICLQFWIPREKLKILAQVYDEFMLKMNCHHLEQFIEFQLIEPVWVWAVEIVLMSCGLLKCHPFVGLMKCRLVNRKQYHKIDLFHQIVCGATATLCLPTYLLCQNKAGWQCQWAVNLFSHTKGSNSNEEFGIRVLRQHWEMLLLQKDITAH